jgi:hypothetical protein
MDVLPTKSKLIRQWLIGVLGAWICVWLLGPFLVNSILVRVKDPELGNITLREGDLIRWRSEGWATTEMGPHGLPGWKPNQCLNRIILWGDSQVEGFCTDDDDKLCNQLVRLAEASSLPIDCIPIGRSGTDAVDWLSQIEQIDTRWSPQLHLFVITELSDLLCLDPQLNSPQTNDRWQVESPSVIAWARRLRAEAVFQAARNVLLDPATGNLRSLRWSVGKSTSTPRETQTAEGISTDARSYERLAQHLKQLNQTLDNRLWIVYAPAVPRFAGDIVTTHPDDAAWETLKRLLDESPVVTIDCRQAFIDQWINHKQVARGFHQGQMSYGHLNAVGNRLIGEAILGRIQERGLKRSSATGDDQ